jgi:hypothetical protein
MPHHDRGARAPTREQLGRHALRYLAGASLVVLAAGIVHETGYREHLWQYVAIAAALTPQVLVDLLAMGDEQRRSRLRVSTRPALVPLLATGALVIGATSTWLSAHAVAAAVAGLSAAAGLAVAGSPITVNIPSRGRG